MRSRLLAIGLWSASLVTAVPATATDWTKDRVRVEGDAMVWSEVSLCHFEPDPTPSGAPKPPQFQIRTVARVPSRGVISRDRFVELVAKLQYELILLVAERHDVSGGKLLDRLRCEGIAEPIGEVDFDLSLTGTVDGYQLEIQDNNLDRTSRTTHGWSEK